MRRALVIGLALACAPPERPAPPAPRLLEDLELLEERVVALLVSREDDVAAFRRALRRGGAVVCHRDLGCTYVPLRAARRTR